MFDVHPFFSIKLATFQAGGWVNFFFNARLRTQISHPYYG